MSDFCCKWTVFYPIFQNIAAWSVGNFKMGSGARGAKKVLIGLSGMIRRILIGWHDTVGRGGGGGGRGRRGGRGGRGGGGAK